MSKSLAASDRSVLLRLASSLPPGDETRKAILAGLRRVLKTAAATAVEPYQKVEGVQYGPGSRKVLFPQVKTERELRALSKLLDRAYEVFGEGQPITPRNRAIADKLDRVGLEPGQLWGGFMLFVTDATGTEYDASNDLGIGG